MRTEMLLLLGLWMLSWGHALHAADDIHALKAELDFLESALIAQESARFSQPAGEAELLLGLRQSGAVRIGGTAEAALRVVQGEEAAVRHNTTNAITRHTAGDSVLTAGFRGDLDLHIDVDASENVSLFTTLEFQAAGNDPNLMEMYLNFNTVLGLPFTLNIGKKELPYGMHNTIGHLDSLAHGDAKLFDASYWYDTTNRAGDNPYRDVGTNDLPGDIDEVLMVEGIWNLRDLVYWHYAVFENPAASVNGGQHEGRPNDSLFYESWATKLELAPLENALLQVSWITMHNDIQGDDDFNDRTGTMGTTGSNAHTWVSGEDNDNIDDQHALSVGGQFTSLNYPVTITAEYQHGWNWGWNDHRDTDTFSGGIVWSATDALDVGVLMEYAYIDSDDITPHFAPSVQKTYFTDEEYYSLYLTAYYTLPNKMYLGLEYMHQWYEGDYSDGTQAALRAVRDDARTEQASASMISFVMGVEF